MCLAGLDHFNLEQTDIICPRYQQLSSVRVLISSGQVTKEVVRYFVKQWRRELEVSLHCLIKEKEGNKLSDTMDMFITLVNIRLDMI